MNENDDIRYRWDADAARELMEIGEEIMRITTRINELYVQTARVMLKLSIPEKH